MKKIICVIILLCCFHFTSAQTEEDYEKIVTSITEAFNSGNKEAILKMCSADFIKATPPEEFGGQFEAYTKELGKVNSHEFWMEGERGNCFLLEFDNASMVLIIKLTSDIKIADMHLEEY